MSYRPLSSFALLVLLLLVARSAAEAIMVQTILPAPTSSGQSAVTLQGRDAVTVIFNASVIALGQDYGAEIPTALVPFALRGASVPGNIRWYFAF